MANWFRLCENRHTDRHRQLRIAQGPPPPPPPSFPSSSPPPPVHLSAPLPPLLLRMEEANFIPPFCPLFLPGSLLFLLLSVLGAAAASGVGVDSSGWWVEDCVEREIPSGAYLLGMQRYGLWTLSLITVRTSRTVLSRDCLCYCSSFMHVHGCVILSETERHVHVLFKCQKSSMLLYLKPLTEWPFLKHHGAPILLSSHQKTGWKSFVSTNAVQQLAVFLFWELPQVLLCFLVSVLELSVQRVCHICLTLLVCFFWINTNINSFVFFPVRLK